MADRTFTPHDVDAAKRLLDRWRAAVAALASIEKGAAAAKVEISGGNVPWRDAPLDLLAAKTALRATADSARDTLRALGVDMDGDA